MQFKTPNANIGIPRHINIFTVSHGPREGVLQSSMVPEPVPLSLLGSGRSLRGEKVFQECSFAKGPRVAHMFNHGFRRLAVGGWRLVAVRRSWQLVVGGGWWLAVGGWWLAAVGGWWRLAGGSPWGRSLRAVLSTKKKLDSLRTALAGLCGAHRHQPGLQGDGESRVCAS